MKLHFRKTHEHNAQSSIHSFDSMGYQSHGLSETYVVTCLGDRYASNPKVPSSRPWPLAFLPPQGACTDKTTHMTQMLAQHA